jgi:2-dehydropantoate 2-reductase
MIKPPKHQMRILICGTGAVGTYIGVSLALAGQRVVFMEKADQVQYLRESGLSLTIQGKKNRLVTPQVAGSIHEAMALGPYDAGILAIKAYDTSGFLEATAEHKSSFPPILCMQNGVENEGRIAEVLGEHKVIAGTLTSAIGKPGRGEVVLEKKRGVGIAAGHPISPLLISVINHAGMNARLYSNPPAMKWSKMVTNLLANASSAILDMTPGEIYADARLFALEVKQVREALAVMRALAIRPVDLPGVPVRILCALFESLPMALSQPLLASSLGSGRGEKMPSFHIDLHSGRGASEVEYLNGAVVRMGQRMGIPTPVNCSLTQILEAIVAGEIALDTYARQPARFLAAVQEAQVALE